MASYPSCHVHPSRKVEIVCLDQGKKRQDEDCPERLVLQCMQCLNTSKCRKHNWKMVEGFIEEIFEVCETDQAKHEKKAQPKPANGQDKHRQSLRQLIDKVSTAVDDVKKRMLSTLEQQAEQIVKQPPEQELYFKTVKEGINNFRRSENRELSHLNGLLRAVHESVMCDGEGVLSLKPLEVVLQEIDQSVAQQELEQLSTRASKMLDSLNVLMEGGQTADEFDKERQQLFSHIETLNQQVRQIPVLKQRIEDQSAKLDLKNKKIQEYEEKLAHIPTKEHPAREESPQHLPHSSKYDNDEGYRVWRASRIQKLLETRDHLNNLILKHCRQCYSDTIRYVRLLPKEDPLRLDVGQSHCEAAGFLNLAVLVVSDELNSLGFSQQVEGAHSITMPIINEKALSPTRRKPNAYGGGYHPPPAYRPMFS